MFGTSYTLMLQHASPRNQLQVSYMHMECMYGMSYKSTDLAMGL